MAFSLTDDKTGAVPLVAVSKSGLAAWRESAPPAERDWVAATGFSGEAGKLALLPDAEGRLGRVLVGVAEGEAAMWAFAGLSESLPPGKYRIDALLAENYPTIHAVGRASTRAPRLVDIRWGDRAAPKVTLVGKGVCFDSGGLDLKTASGMKMMTKDMGGAAHALALAGLVMGAGLKVRLHCLVPAVENAIAGNAFRPGDVLRSRKGLTVEIGNTDAEGRLILGDALARASEENPALVIDFATLTGAARVAVGPDLPAQFTRRDETADALLAAGKAHDDPCWRLPLHEGYVEWLKSDVADTNNAHTNAFAGASVAALFLDKFVGADLDWAHFDTFAWRPNGKPGRPKGGDALGLRAAWHMLRERFG
jgi:leucyl aminopeptidase